MDPNRDFRTVDRYGVDLHSDPVQTHEGLAYSAPNINLNVSPNVPHESQPSEFAKMLQEYGKKKAERVVQVIIYMSKTAKSRQPLETPSNSDGNSEQSIQRSPWREVVGMHVLTSGVQTAVPSGDQAAATLHKGGNTILNTQTAPPIPIPSQHAQRQSGIVENHNVAGASRVSDANANQNLPSANPQLNTNGNQIRASKPQKTTRTPLPDSSILSRTAVSEKLKDSTRFIIHKLSNLRKNGSYLLYLENNTLITMNNNCRADVCISKRGRMIHCTYRLKLASGRQGQASTTISLE